MTDDVKLEVIKKTQDLLGKYFKKPPLTEKLLKKPPFRFLHDIVTAVIRETGFLEGLFTEDELNSDNIKDKEAKLAFLTKLVDVVKLISGSNLTVRPSKIISGQEPAKTNELLQAIGKALDKKVSSAEAIEHYKRNLEKKSKSSSKGKSTSREEKKSARRVSETRRPEEKEKSSVESKKRSSSTSRTSNSGREEDRKRKEQSEKGGNEETPKGKEPIEIPPAEPVQERTSSSSQKRKQSARSKQNHAPPVSSADLSKLNALQNHEKKIDEYVRRKDSASRTKPSQQSQSTESQNQPATIAEVSSIEESDASKLNNAETEKNIERSDITESKESASTEKELPQQAEKIEAPVELQQSQPESIETSRPKTSLRPPSVRPISARPAAPRMRAKTELVVNEEIPTPMGTISVIVENSDMKDDDDAEDMIVMETKGGGDSLENVASYKLDNQLSQEHGHLVAQILETQRELVNNENVDVLPKKTDIAWDVGSKRDREVVIKEIDKLRGTIQTLTRATNPLGKLLDYVQEDVEMMQKELIDWRKQYQQIEDQLEMERLKTKDLIEPMKETLKEIDNHIKIQLDKICQAKSQIIKNDQKIQTLLNGHS